jgi:hypothetical protein
MVNEHKADVMPVLPEFSTRIAQASEEVWSLTF